MLKYTTSTVQPNDEGIVSPAHHPELDYTRRTLEVAGGKPGSRMAIKKSRGGMRRILAKEQRDLQLKNQVCRFNGAMSVCMPSYLTSYLSTVFWLVEHCHVQTPYFSHGAANSRWYLYRTGFIRNCFWLAMHCQTQSPYFSVWCL